MFNGHAIARVLFLGILQCKIVHLLIVTVAQIILLTSIRDHWCYWSHCYDNSSRALTNILIVDLPCLFLPVVVDFGLILSIFKPLFLLLILDLFLSDLRLLVQLDDSNESYQSYDPDYPRDSAGAGSLGQLGGVARAPVRPLPRHEVPEPADVGQHGQRRDEVQPEEEGQEVDASTGRTNEDLDQEDDETGGGDREEGVVFVL